MKTNLVLLCVAVHASMALAQSSTNVWTLIGPWGGNIESLALDPQDSATLYAGTPRGLFKSADRGASWRLVNSTHLAPTTASIDPQNPSTMYAGLGYGNAPNGGPWLFKSTDRGVSWTLSNSGLEEVGFAGSLTVDPRDSSTVYIATAVYLSNPCIQNKNCLIGQVFKSTDGGASWSPASAGLPPVDAQIRSLVIDPEDSRTLYVTANTYAAGTSKGEIYKSTNGGASWSVVNSGAVVQVLAMDPQNHNWIYAATTSGLLRSTNAGGDWSLASTNLPGQYISSLVIDPRDTSTVYVAAQGSVFKSVDGGKSWAATAFPSGWNASTYLLVLDPQNSSTVYAASSNGVFKSADGGSAWSPSSLGLGGVSVNSFALDPQNAGTIYATTSLGLVKSVNGGASWSPLNDSLTGQNPCIGCGSLALDRRNPGTLYEGVSGNLGFTYQGGHVLKSTDAGASWNAVGDPSFTASGGTLSLGGYFWFSGHVGIDPQNSNTLYAWGLTPQRTPGSSSYIFKSTDGGNNWTPLTSLRGYDFQVLVFDPQNSATLYTAVGQSISKSSDGGSSWSAGVPLPVPPEVEPQDCDDFWVPVSSLAVDPADSNKVYATGSGGVFKSADGGATWTTLDSQLSAYSCSQCYEPYLAGSVAIDARNSTLYVIFGGGVLGSTDGGTSWAPLSAGLPAPPFLGFSTLAFDPTNSSRLYLAGYGDGIYTITLDH